MNYTETLDYLYHKLPMFSRIGSAAFKKDLTNTKLLCERLGNPQEKFKSIHIAGTNGKGSVSHMMASIFQAAGYKTGLYTSPHLYDFRERIKIDGEMAPESFVVDFTEKVKPWIEEIEPSFFEITVAMAFDFFAQQNVDIAIVEVGLGGRLDSTNIIHPELSIITNISLDHTNILGNTLEEIAGEKAGIIKQSIPVVIGEKNDQTKPVFERIANEKRATITYAEDHVNISSFSIDHSAMRVVAKQKDDEEEYELDLPGIYQLKNLKTVLTAVDVLKKTGWTLSSQAVKSGLKEAKKRTGLHGRWEVIRKNPTVVLEVAHNEAGIQQMLQQVQQLSYVQLHIVLGMVKDKDIDTVLQLLPTEAVYYFTQAQIPRALDKEALGTKAQQFGLAGNTYTNVNEAIQQALLKASEEDLIIVCGSIFLVAEVQGDHFRN